jgi:hypothetical protein
MAKVASQTVTVDFEEYVGDTLLMLFNYKDSTGAVIDLTGTNAVLTIATTLDTPPVLTLTEALNDGIILGGTPSNIVCEIKPSQTVTLAVGTFVYRLRLTDSLLRVNTLVVGKIKLIK